MSSLLKILIIDFTFTIFLRGSDCACEFGNEFELSCGGISSNDLINLQNKNRIHHLFINNSNIQVPPNGFQFNRLETLTITSSTIETKSFHLFARTLESLSLTSSKIKFTRSIFKNTTLLTKLVLSKIEIHLLPNVFGRFSKLQWLDLSGNQIPKVEVGILNSLPTLIKLDLSYNEISLMELGCFDNFPNLKSLNLGHNKISELPLGILDESPIVEELRLNNNNISVIPLGVFDQNLKIINLDFSFNLLRDIPLGTLDNLNKTNNLNVSHNRLLEIKQGLLDHLFELRIIDFSYNALERIPLGLFDRSTKIQEIYLNNNKIKSIGLLNSKLQLAKLDLSFNDLSSTKAIFENLLKITEINLANNKIKEFQSFPTSVQKLNLSHNKIENIPDIVNPSVECVLLQELDLSYNQLTFVKNSTIQKMCDLRYFRVGFNPWQCPCLFQVLDLLQRLLVKYDTESMDGKSPVCVYGTSPNCLNDLAQSSYFQVTFNLWASSNDL